MPEEIQEKQNLIIDPQPQICNTGIINRKMSDKELSIYDGLKYFRPVQHICNAKIQK